MSRAARWLPAAWAFLLSLLMLGPGLAPGYVLSYDMVWVPDLALRPDFLGLGSALPRAVPSDAVVAVVDEVVPGMLLQKLVLAGALVGAGVGAARLVGGLVPVQLVAVSVAIWNPFVAERLVIGHWPVLLGYAVLPWLFVMGRDVRAQGRLPGRLPFLLVIGSLSATAGLATALVALLAGWQRGAGRVNVQLLALVAAANAPWLVAGLVHARDATSDPVGGAIFATSGEGWLPGPLAALSLGGIWNAEVVPSSRTGVLGVVFLGLLVLLAGLGLKGLVTNTSRRELSALVIAWAVGLGVAVGSWAAPGAFGQVAAHLPGGGLLRDGSRLLGLSAPLLMMLAAHGAAAVRRGAPDRVTRVVCSGILAVLPITVMPDAAFGVSGTIRAVDLPEAYSDARAAVNSAPAGKVVVLPFTSYRAPSWNRGHKVLDPLPRYLDRDTVGNDDLLVSGRLVAGEDPAAAAVAEVMARESPAARSAGLVALGVTAVAAAEVPGQTVPEVDGRRVLTHPEVTVLVLTEKARHHDTPTSWVVAMAAAWGAWGVALVLGAVLMLRRSLGPPGDSTFHPSP